MLEDRQRHKGSDQGRSAKALVASLVAAATLIGVVAFWRFSTSERFLSGVMVEVRDKGKTATPEQCVDEVVRQAAKCEAMKSLCDASAPRWMNACLRGTDRSAYCASLGSAPRATSFGYEACKRREVDRRTKKACASAYRAIAAHCSSLVAGEESWVSSSSH